MPGLESDADDYVTRPFGSRTRLARAGHPAPCQCAGQDIGNVSFEQADAQIHPFPAGSFDVAISRTGTMFFGDPAAAFTNIGRALRPGGRLVMLAWQGPGPNEWVRELSGALAAGRDLPAPPADAPGPFSLADSGRTRTLLASAGFSDIRLDALNGPMWFGSDPDDAHASCSASWDGCSTVSTTPGASARWARSGPRSPPMPAATGSPSPPGPG